MAKRSDIADNEGTTVVVAAQPAKRAKADGSGGKSLMLRDQKETTGAVVRTVLSCAFSPSGRILATSSFDRSILLWHAHGATQNFLALQGHAGPVTQVQWSRDGTRLCSSSTDMTVGIWDAETGERIKRFKGHASFVNACSMSKRGPELVASVDDDGFLMLWDQRQKLAVKELGGKFPLTATAFSLDGGIVFTGGIENDISAWDLRQDRVSYTLQGHEDTITSLRISPEGDKLLSNAMDNTVRIWDVKPFTITPSRFLKTFEGAPHGFEKNLIRACWSPDSQFVAAGSGDRSVVVWDVATQKIVYKLPGHKGCVNDVDWASTLLASASNDKTVFLGELNTSEVK
ncbi:WD40-repeat-containing domain protein [Entophlyctis helioformis]|nr:WD40-repeat-containing domain protein [Entophlyctis helioformis]